jgi:chaperonin GroES
MKLRPLQDRVLVRRVEPEAKTAGGILIPDTAQEKPMEGEVVAVGTGVRDTDGKLHPLEIKTGDRVLFGKWSGTEVKDHCLIALVQCLAHRLRSIGYYTVSVFRRGLTSSSPRKQKASRVNRLHCAISRQKWPFKRVGIMSIPASSALIHCSPHTWRERPFPPGRADNFQKFHCRG